MKCVAICQNELFAKALCRAISPRLELEILLEDQALVRRLRAAGIPARAADSKQLDTYVKTDIAPTTCIIVEDHEKQNLTEILTTIADAGTGLVYVISSEDKNDSIRSEKWWSNFPEVNWLSLGDLLQISLLDELGRSLTRRRVRQYQRYFSDAERVLILLHNDPDPDAMASGLALRSLLNRTKNTSTIGAFHGVSRPENLRMINLLDITIEPLTAESLTKFDLIATVDVQPHYFGNLLNRADLVIDHHPEQAGYTAAHKDIRPDYGSTSTILTEHLRAVNANVSERTATAMLYAIKSDTLFLTRNTGRVDLEAFTYLYALANTTLIRKIEGTEITPERLQYVARAVRNGQLLEQTFSAHIGTAPREDLISYVADFLLQVENVKWSIVSGIVNNLMIISVRNLEHSRNADEFVKRWFSEIGNAGGHHTMAKATIPLEAFRKTFGSSDAKHVTQLIGDLAAQFLREQTGKG